MGRTTQQNKITTPELIEQINPENKELLKDYIEYLQSIDRAKTTIYQYEQDLNTFFVWNLINNKNKFFVSIVKKDYIKYQSYLINENGNSPKRIRRLKSVISSLSKYIEDICDDVYPQFRCIIKKLESPVNEASREKTVIEEELLYKVLDSLVAKEEYAKACYVALSAFSGARKAEVLRFKVSYFKPENIVYGALYKTPEKMITKGRGSGGKLLVRYCLVKEFDPYLNLWLKQREEMGVESDWLFVTKNADSWIQTKPSTVDKWFEKISDEFQVPFYPHALRHFNTTMMKKHNIPDSVLLSLQGWASAEMVKIYNDTNIDDELGKYFDEGGIKKDIKEGKISDLK